MTVIHLYSSYYFWIVNVKVCDNKLFENVTTFPKAFIVCTENFPTICFKNSPWKTVRDWNIRKAFNIVKTEQPKDNSEVIIHDAKTTSS